jgi:receptor expression-enhancing protein 5/6
MASAGDKAQQYLGQLDREVSRQSMRQLSSTFRIASLLTMTVSR